MNANGATKWFIAGTTTLATFMEILDTSVANVALPHMQGTYAAGTDEITWVITSYLVANAIILPITGWLGSYFSRKRVYVTCLLLFTLASFGSGAAPSLGVLIFMRVLQGLSGGAMVPMSMAILLETFPKGEHGKATAIFGIGAIFGPILGPLVGGWITDNWSWPWIFYINVPVGLLAAVLSVLLLKDPEYLKRPEGRVDYWSFLFVAVGLGSLEVFLNRGERYDWLESPFIRIFGAAALLGIVLFVWRSFTARDPLVDLRILKNREFTSGIGLIFMASFGMYGAFVMVPLFVQNLMGYTPTWAGLVLSPGGVASLVAMAAVGYLYGKVDVRGMVGAGFFLLAVSCFMLTSVNLSVGYGYLVTAWLFHGLGLGLLFVPIGTVCVSRIAPEKMGVATSLFNLMRNEGGSVGIAVASTFLARRAQFHHSVLAEHVSSYNPAFQQGMQTLQHGAAARAGADPVTASAAALGMLGQEVQRQAYLLSFVDVFWFLMLVFAVSMPFILLLRSGRGEHVSLGH